MATFEEKILAYLDDSLSSEEREDVLGQIAGGDARATRLFNAHLRLQDLYGLAAKPVSAPLALQRELASKVPVLAIKLPYLAMPEDRRKRAAGWFWELPSFRMNAILILLSALLTGGIWFGVKSGRSGHVTETNFARPGATSGSSFSGNVPQNIAPHNANAIGAAIPSRTSSLKNAHRSNFSQKTYSSDLAHRTYPTHSLKSQGATSAKSNSLKSNNAPPLNDADAMEPTAVLPKTSSVAPASLVRESEPDLYTIDVSPPPAMFHAAEAIPIPVNAEREKSYTPVRAFVAENIRSIRLATQANPSDFARHYGVWQSSITTESPELGIDYEITPWVAIGARAGDARFIQEQQISHLESKSGGYGHLTSEVTETALLDPFTPWACAAMTYSQNPGERFEYSFTAAAGDIFVNGFSPTVLGEAAAIYKFEDAVALRMSLSYQASWVASANPISATSTQANSNVSGSAIQSVTSKLYPSQSLGFSLGVMFHP